MHVARQEIPRRDHIHRTGDGERLLDDDRQRRTDGRAFEFGEQPHQRSIIPFDERAAVEVGDILFEVSHRRSSEHLFDDVLRRRVLLALVYRRGNAVEYAPQVLDRQDVSVILSHLVDVPAHYAVEALQDDRVLCVRDGLLRHAGVLEGHLRLRGVQRRFDGAAVVPRRHQREIRRLIEDIDAVELTGNLVALFAQHGKIALHRVDVSRLLLGQLTDDLSDIVQRHGVQLSGQVYLSLAAFFVFAAVRELEAAGRHVFICLIALGVSIDGHDVLQRQRELLAALQRERVRLLHIPLAVAGLFDLLVKIFLGFLHVLRPYTFGLDGIPEQIHIRL